MFSGIIENTGKVIKCLSHSDTQKIFIEINKSNSKVSIGDSIAINGACLTVEEINSNVYAFTVSPETLKKTTLKNLEQNSNVNIETPLTLEKFINGHLTSGHIDSVGKIFKIVKTENSWNILVEVEKNIIKYLVSKGSIAMDGVSLTINGINKNILDLMIIPYTHQNTIIKFYKEGRLVNIEVDLILKYLEKIKNG
tara:strand:+ start:55 stop:642 length:588 start_codon:yes stop_codon:yes gene_type:complete